jgi:hypothetical protein
MFIMMRVTPDGFFFARKVEAEQCRAMRLVFQCGYGSKEIVHEGIWFGFNGRMRAPSTG